MRDSIGGRRPVGTPLIESIGWGGTLALVPAIGMIAYRRWRQTGEDRRTSPRRWPDWLFLGGAMGQVAYGVAAGNRLCAASGACLALGESLGLAAARKSRLVRPRPTIPAHALSHATTGQDRGDFQTWNATPGGIPMNSRNPDHDDTPKNDDRQKADTSPQRPDGAPEPQTIDTDDPVIVSGPPERAQWKRQPDSTMVVETNRIQEPDTVRNPAVLMVPVEYESTADRGSNPRTGRDRSERDDDQRRREKDRDDRDHDHDDDDDRDGATSTAPSMMKTLLFAGLVALACGIAGAWGYSYFFGGSKSGDQTASNGSDSQNSQKKSSASSKGKSDSKSGDNDSPKAETGKEIPGFTRADDAETLRKQNEHLAERIDRLSERIDMMTQPRNQTPPDLRTLQIKVGNLARTVEDMGDLPSRFRTLENRMEDLDQELKILKSNMSSAGDNGGASTTGAGLSTDLPKGTMSRSLPILAPEPQPATETPFDLLAAPDAALTEGIRLFRDGRYRDAQNIFRKLQLTRSWDARVWYFSALTRGLLTGDWSDETRELVARGLKLEKESQPPSAQVDASLSGLTKAQGKEWLASFRAPTVAKR